MAYQGSTGRKGGRKLGIHGNVFGKSHIAAGMAVVIQQSNGFNHRGIAGILKLHGKGSNQGGGISTYVLRNGPA